MASGNTGGRNTNSSNTGGSKGFVDLVDTDDVLCSYDDYSNNTISLSSDPSLLSHSSKEFHKTRMAGSLMFPTSSYISPEESSNNDVITSVERTMKKYTENIMRFLEGISSRLSQLELYCYNLDKSIGEMRSELVRDHEEADTKLKSLEKHVQEVHRSVQILRDKQELADTQKELAKLQLAQKTTPQDSDTKNNDTKNTSQASDTKNTDNSPNINQQQLALTLPQQVPHQPQQQAIPPPPPPQQYYHQPSQIPNQSPQNIYIPSDSSLYRTQQAPPQPQGNQTPHLHPTPQYQQQWPPQQATPQQTPSMQTQVRPSASSAYPPYLPNQPANVSQPETLPNSMPMQVPYSGIPQPGGNRVETAPYGYGAPVRPIQQQPPPQQLKSQYGGPPDGYASSHSSLSSGNSYMMYQNEGGRAHHPHQSHYAEGTYPAPSVPHQGPPSNTSANMARPPQFTRNHPYNELVEKLVGMGYRGDHVTSIIQRLEENGQPVDFNAVLDILNGHSSGSSQRGWSG